MLGAANNYYIIVLRCTLQLKTAASIANASAKELACIQPHVWLYTVSFGGREKGDNTSALMQAQSATISKCSWLHLCVTCPCDELHPSTGQTASMIYSLCTMRQCTGATLLPESNLTHNVRIVQLSDCSSIATIATVATIASCGEPTTTPVLLIACGKERHPSHADCNNKDHISPCSEHTGSVDIACPPSLFW